MFLVVFWCFFFVCLLVVVFLVVHHDLACSFFLVVAFFAKTTRGLFLVALVCGVPFFYSISSRILFRSWSWFIMYSLVVGIPISSLICIAPCMYASHSSGVRLLASSPAAYQWFSFTICCSSGVGVVGCFMLFFG